MQTELVKKSYLPLAVHSRQKTSEQSNVLSLTRYSILTFVGAFFGTYSILLCGGVFSNAQTNNLINLLFDLKNGSFGDVCWHVGALLLFILGISLTVILPKQLEKHHICWKSICLGTEIICTLAVGFLPASAPTFAFLAPLFLAAALQYNTFTDCCGANVSTLFCTNNVRQLVISFWNHQEKSDKTSMQKMKIYVLMLLSFFGGTLFCVFATNLLHSASIFLASVTLFVCLLEQSVSSLKKQTC